MDPRLEEASHAGDLEALHRLLQEDSLLLAQFSATTPSVANNPLHIAALIGHADFVREVLRLNPSLARDTNANGLTPLHLASAKGRLAVVRELLSVSGGSDLCGICDGDGLLPVHTAAAKGRTEVLVELMIASPDSFRQLTRREETTLHWAVRSGCYKAVEVLVERVGIDEVSFLNSKDDEGNTIMHLAATMRQFQIVKMLLTRRGIGVNEVNARGLTVLDVLLESPNECRDLELIEMILAAGGKPASGRERGPNQPSQSSSARAFQYFIGLSLRIISWLGLSPPTCRPNSRPNSQEEESTTPQTLMVVATIIATITFQPVLSPPSPPGGPDLKPVLSPPGGPDLKGNATRGDELLRFLVCDMVGLFASLSIILLLICVQPRQKKKLMRILVWVMWIAVFSTALAFTSAALIVFPNSNVVSCFGDLWNVVYQIIVLWVYYRLAIYLFHLVGWWEPLDTRTSHTAWVWISLTIERALVIGVVVVVPTLCFRIILYYFRIVSFPHWSCYLLGYWVMMMEFPLLYLSVRFTVYLLRRARSYIGSNSENHLPEVRLNVARTRTDVLIATTIYVFRFFAVLIFVCVVIFVVVSQVYFFGFFNVSFNLCQSLGDHRSYDSLASAYVH